MTKLDNGASRFEREAWESPVGVFLAAINRDLEKAGRLPWDIQHTGGGCVAWERWSDDRSQYCWITDCDGISLGLENGLDAACFIAGCYIADGDCWLDSVLDPMDPSRSTYRPSLTVAAALAWCGAELAKPAARLLDYVDGIYDPRAAVALRENERDAS
jgi:hypothetical protein